MRRISVSDHSEECLFFYRHQRMDMGWMRQVPKQHRTALSIEKIRSNLLILRSPL